MQTVTAEWKRPEEKLMKPTDPISWDSRQGWGDGKSQCYFYHLEVEACENNRCYYFPAPAAGSTCTGYVHCPIFQRIQKEYASDSGLRR